MISSPFCTLLAVPEGLEVEARRHAIDERPDNDRRPAGGAGPELVGWVSKLWAPGRRLRVGFVSGAAEDRRFVRETAVQWTAHANLSLDFVEDASTAEIRVEIHARSESHSLHGTDALLQPRDKPTMGLGFGAGVSNDEKRRLVLHEFGHALGLVHEHQSPVAAIPWNKPKVYEYYKRVYGWSSHAVDVGIFQRYSASETRYSGFDRSSIMLYPIPRELTDGVFHVDWNRELSAQDKAFVRKLYPERHLRTLTGSRQDWVDAHIDVRAGDVVTVKANGWIRFFGGTYRRDPDGRDERGNVEQPAWRYDNAFGRHCAPHQRKNSLVFRLVDWPFQALSGVPVTMPTSGRLFMTNNDNHAADNEGEWTIELVVG